MNHIYKSKTQNECTAKEENLCMYFDVLIFDRGQWLTVFLFFVFVFNNVAVRHTVHRERERERGGGTDRRDTHRD